MTSTSTMEIKVRTERLILAVCVLSMAWCCVSACGEENGRPPLYNDWEITERTPLLDAQGGLAAWGWSRRPLMELRRVSIPESAKPRYKEWDFYAISSPECYLELTLANISWAVLASVIFIDYQTQETSMNLQLGQDADALVLPADPYESVTYDTLGRHLAFSYSEKVRTLTFDFPKTLLVGPSMRGAIRIQDDPNEENLATAMPFDAPGSFFYTNKMVALPASGSVEVAGKAHSFPSGQSFAVLDWGRGVWPSEFAWGWAVGAGMADGKRVGFNIGFGDEDNARASGNSVVVDGILHKLGKIDWTWTKNAIMQPWHFKSEDQRFDVMLEPAFDQSGEVDLGKYYANLTKVHGKASGRVVLDDGTAIAIKGLLAFAEHAVQRW